MKIDKSCGCLIDDLHDDNRLCGSSPEDMKVMVDPDPERISLDFYQKEIHRWTPRDTPTQARVKKFYHYSSREPDDVIANNCRQGWVRPPLRRLP